MISLILTIFCSTSIALILKHNDTKMGHPLLLLAGNYLVAAVISLIYIAGTSNAAYSLSALLFGSLLAFLFVFAFFAFAMAVKAAGTALATVSSRLSVIVPIVLSIVIYNEQPSLWQNAGFLLTVITIIFFYFSLRGNTSGKLNLTDYFYLFMVLMGIGINDFCMKVFSNWRPANEEPLFLLSIFGFSFLYTSAIVRIKKIGFDKQTFFRGAILGVPNMFSSFFLLGALAQLPAIFVYPVTNIGIILLTALGAYLIWKEGLNKSGRWALISGMLAILLLSID